MRDAAIGLAKPPGLEPEARHRDRRSKTAAVIAAVAAMMLIALLARGSSQVALSPSRLSSHNDHLCGSDKGNVSTVHYGLRSACCPRILCPRVPSMNYLVT